MKKLGTYYTKIESIRDDIDNYIGELEEKRDAIEDRAIERDREMTEKEQERYDKLDAKIYALNDLVSNLNEALYDIEGYWSED